MMQGRQEPSEPESLEPGEVAMPLWLGVAMVVGGYLTGMGLAVYEATAGGGNSVATYGFALALIVLPHAATKPLLILRLLLRGGGR